MSQTSIPNKNGQMKLTNLKYTHSVSKYNPVLNFFQNQLETFSNSKLILTLLIYVITTMKTVNYLRSITNYKIIYYIQTLNESNQILI